jgi:hypothetical protein
MKQVFFMTLNCVGILLVSMIMSCDGKKCDHEFLEYEPLERPYVYVTGNGDRPCVYSLEMYYWIDSLQFSSKGEMIFGNDTIFINLQSLKNAHIPYFIFSQPIGQRYQILLDNKLRFEKTAKLEAYIQDIRQYRGKDVYIFRVLNAFSYDVYLADIVYFVTRENGVIGCYRSAFEGETEVYLDLRGEVLESIIEYPPGNKRYLM